jgi:hypothetical protein
MLFNNKVLQEPKQQANVCVERVWKEGNNTHPMCSKDLQCVLTNGLHFPCLILVACVVQLEDKTCAHACMHSVMHAVSHAVSQIFTVTHQWPPPRCAGTGVTLR